MKNKIVFMIRNSGHGFTKTLDDSFRGDGMQLSLAKMDKVTVDSKKNTITVQGGVKNWQVIDALWKVKKRTCKTTSLHTSIQRILTYPLPQPSAAAIAYHISELDSVVATAECKASTGS